MKNIVEIENLSLSYKDKNVVNDLSLNIPYGSYTVLCGKNGIGKSSIIKGILGLHPISGKVKIDGLELNKKNLKKIRSMIGVVFENPNTNLVCETVEDELKFTLKNLGCDKKTCDNRIKEIATKLKIESLLQKLTTHLSGGEKQLVAFASAIILKPKLLILDEAFTMLDFTSKERIRKYIKNYYKETKCTILEITNDMDDLLYATDIAILKDGQIQTFGKKEDILKDEKVFKECGLNMPFMAELSLKLKYYGLIEDPILDIDKMVKYLWK